MSLVERFHGGYVELRRVRVLITILGTSSHQNAQVLDVGCGDGLLARRLMQERPDLNLLGSTSSPEGRPISRSKHSTAKRFPMAMRLLTP